MKFAKVLPIYKSENEQLVQNYRPISVLPYFSKIYERVIYNHIIDSIDQGRQTGGGGWVGHNPPPEFWRGGWVGHNPPPP